MEAIGSRAMAAVRASATSGSSLPRSSRSRSATWRTAGVSGSNSQATGSSSGACCCTAVAPVWSGDIGSPVSTCGRAGRASSPRPRPMTSRVIQKPSTDCVEVDRECRPRRAGRIASRHVHSRQRLALIHPWRQGHPARGSSPDCHDDGAQASPSEGLLQQRGSKEGGQTEQQRGRI